MIKSRTLFLEGNYYLPLKNKLNEIIQSFNLNSLLDLACGEGYYTKSFNIKEKYGIDLSKEGIIHASKNDKSTKYIISSIFDLPFLNNSFDIITTIFAPISDLEIQRVLKKNGFFILVTPGEKHLFELKEIIYDDIYLNPETNIDINGLRLIKQEKLEFNFTLNSNELIKSLFTMTPYYYKTSKKDASKLDSIDYLSIQASFIIQIFKHI
ncbi:MAG: methyltransferase domain-containing protein [Erysipelotrichaceae bacterium]|nr:methyltransferase domain-containing protein [Erysipelotrichaceae bacterium]